MSYQFFAFPELYIFGWLVHRLALTLAHSFSREGREKSVVVASQEKERETMDRRAVVYDAEAVDDHERQGMCT